MAVNQSLFMDLLRLLTPEEISELTTTSQGDTRVSLTKIIKDRFAGIDYDFTSRQFEQKGATILAFPSETSSTELETKELQAGPLSISLINSYLFEEDFGDFLHLERKRFSDSQKAIRQLDVHKVYQKSLAVDVIQEKSKREYSPRSGVLVNKKHY